MHALLHDLRYAWRKLAKNPGFTAVAVFTLALGIGANTAIFSVVDGVLLSPLPYDDPEQLVFVWDRMIQTENLKAPMSAPDFADLDREVGAFAGLAASNNVNESVLTEAGAPLQVSVAGVTWDFFDVLGVEPFVGQGFTEADAAPMPPGVFQDPEAEIPSTAVVLSNGLWQRRFAADPTVIGRTLRLNGQPHTVVGVMGADFRLLVPPDAGMPAGVDAWTPFRFDLAGGARDNQWLRVIGRLAPGVSLAEAQQQVDAFSDRLRTESAFHDNMGIVKDVKPLHGDAVAHVRPVLWSLLGAVGFVLLIACANVANLLLARSTLRGREMAVRTALGAGRGRIFRQVLAEGALLALLGGAAGVGLAHAGLRLLVALEPADLPRLEGVGLDAGVLAFTLAATLAAALLASLAPALDLAAVRPRAALQERGGSGGGRLRLRSVLVVAEVALSLVLLAGAGLMLRSFVSLSHVDPGYRAEGVVTYKLNLPFLSYRDADQRLDLFARLDERVGELPGVESAGAVFPLPLAGRLWTGPWGLPGEAQEEWSKNEANFRATRPGFFEAMGAHLLAGRTLERADVEDRREVVVIDDRLAAKAFRDQPAVGSRIALDLFGEAHEMEVVGVVAHMRHDSLAVEGRETIYLPHHYFPWSHMYMTVRTAGVPPESVLPGIRREVAALDPGLPVYGERPMVDYVEEALAPTRFVFLLLALFAGVAVLLAAVGLFGVISFAVRQRTREIGIRLALGAPAASILRLVMGRGLLLIGLGVAFGIAAALALTRVLASQLHGVSWSDPATYAAIALLLVAVALAASWLPARRAMEVDPMESLRSE
ncbi:MAG TPA: ABC transporter permease [Thermoanaerobaculia bacterium]|nr:ABC transporter permease [Thermoanaerobaculia bacterium]